MPSQSCVSKRNSYLSAIARLELLHMKLTATPCVERGPGVILEYLISGSFSFMLGKVSLLPQ